MTSLTWIDVVQKLRTTLKSQVVIGQRDNLDLGLSMLIDHVEDNLGSARLPRTTPDVLDVWSGL